MLREILEPLREKYAAIAPPELLAGLAGPDDAAVFQIDDERAVIMTADFFPPVLDDPYLYGAVGAANALSDVYAMGGDALLAINLVAWPDNADETMLESVLRGGADKVSEAGAFLAGGHTLVDREPKYGLAVTGLVKPERLLRKGGALHGDVLVLTKPLGSGTITTAIKRGSAADAHVETCVGIMATLNRGAMQAAQSIHPQVHAATDVTGFGLLGHAHEMSTQSACGLRIEWQQLCWMEGAEEYARADNFAGGATRNADYYSQWVKWERGLTEWKRRLLFDPQTSGGLLLAVAAESVADFLRELDERGQFGFVVGEAVGGRAGEIAVY